MSGDKLLSVFVNKILVILGDSSGTFVVGQEESQAKRQKKGA